MADYTSREAVLTAVCNLCCVADPMDCGFKIVHDGTDCCTLVKMINEIPAADVRPVVRGRWIRPTRVPDSMLDECSVCGFDAGSYTFNFCPNCNADMRKEN